MYSAKAIMDNGKTFSFDWENGILFDISPLSGANVEIQRSQGFGQIGETVEGQSLHGISRTIKGTCLSEAAAWALVRAFPAFSSGRLFVNGWFCDFVVSKTPAVTTKKREHRKFTMQIYCPLPYWQSETESAYTMGEVVPEFQFPTTLNSYSFGSRDASAFINVQNGGSVDVPVDVVLTADVDVSNPGIINVLTGDELTMTCTVHPGDTIHIYRKNGELYVDKTADGVTESILGQFDPASTLLWVHPGDNLLKAVADTNASHLVAVVTYRAAEMGVVV